MPVVQGPDGKIIEFPESMTPSQIDAAMRQTYGGGQSSPKTDVLPTPVRVPLGMASNALGSLAATVGLPGTVEEIGDKYLPNWMTKPLFSKPGTPPGPTIFPSSQELLSATNALGVTNNPHLAPQSAGERYADAAAGGVGAVLPMLGTGGLTAPLLASGATSGVTSQGATDLFPHNSWAPIVAGTAAGFAEQGLLSAFSHHMVESVAGGLGESKTMEDAGKFGQDAARQWLKFDMPDKMEQVWQPVDRAIPATTETPLTGTMAALQSMTGKGGQVLGKAVAALVPGKPKQLLDILNNSPLSLGVNPAWEDVRSLRTALGDAIANPSTVKDISGQQIDTLYRAVTQDMRATAHNQGAGDLFDQANAESNRLYGIAKGPIAKLVKSDTPTEKDPMPAKAAGKLLSDAKKGGSDLATLRTELPDVVDELAAAHLRNPGAWTGLSPEGREALIPDIKTRNLLDEFIPQRMPKVGGLQHGAELAGGGIVGGAAAGALSHLLFGTPGNSLFPEQVGATVSALAPSVYRGVSHAIKHPNVLRLPAAGALAGNANALTGQ